MSKNIQLLFILLSFLSFNYELKAQCNNADFELGNFSGWTGGRGTPNGGSGNFPGGCCPIVINNMLNTAALVPPRHSIITGAVTDPNTLNNLSEVAPGGNFSARLGSWQVSAYDQNNPGPLPGSKSEMLSYSFTVTAANPLFVYQYAVVLEDPDTIANQHTSAEKPRFEISVLDASGNYVPDPICGHYMVVADSNLTGFNTGVVTTSSVIHYRDWTTVGIDLSSYIGQVITIVFQVGDCALGGHFGYAYIDAYCAPSGIITEYCVGQNNVTLTAPSGFSYMWSPGGDTTQTISISSPVVGTVYTCQITSVTGCVANISTVLQPTLIYPDFNYTVDCITNTTSFFDSTQISNGSISDYSWNFGDGSPVVNSIQNPTHTYSDTGVYNVQLIVFSSSGCSDTINKTVNIIDISLSVPSTNTICTDSSTSVSITATGSNTYSWSPNISLNSSTGATVIASPTITTTYTVTTTNSQGCTAALPSVVNVNPGPIIAISATNDSLCLGESVSINVIGANSYSWSPSSGLNSTTGSSIISTPLSNTTYTITGYDILGCGNTVTVPIIIKPNPIVNTANPAVCLGESAIINASGASSYLWSTGQTTSSITVSPISTTIFNIIGTLNGCSDTTSAIVSILPLPLINVLNSGGFACSGGNLQLTATGAATYSWSPSTWLNNTNSSSVISTPTSNITYTVIGTDLNGCSSTISVPVTVGTTPPLNPNLSDTSVCMGNSVSLNISGANSYSWSPATYLTTTTGTNVTVNPTASITYTVIGTDISGCTASLNFTINLLPNPILNISSNSNQLCIGSSTNLQASGASTYTWSPNGTLSSSTGTNVTANPISNTTYTVIGTNTNGCAGSTSYPVVVNPNPILNINANNPNICIGDTTILTSTGAVIYSWSPSTSLISSTGNTVAAHPINNITYNVTGTDANGCTGNTTVTVIVNPLPLITSSSSLPGICIYQSATLNAQGAVSYIWSPPSGLSATSGSSVIANPTQAITYTVTGTDINGCKNISQVPLNVYPPPNIIFNPNNPTICPGEIANLFVSGSNNYIWSTGSTGNTISVNPVNTSSYSVSATDANGCTSSNATEVTVNPAPIVVALPAQITLCYGQTTNMAAIGAINYFWSPSFGLNTTTGNYVTTSADVTTEYYVTGYNVYGCSDTATVLVNINQLPPTTVGPDVSFCIGGSSQLNAIGAISYTWIPANGLSSSNIPNPIVNVNSSTQYTVTGIDQNGCEASDTIDVTVYELPIVNAGPDKVVCLGDSTILSGSGALNYLWSPNIYLDNYNVQSPISTPTNNITYTLIGIDNFGCINLDSVALKVINPFNIIVSPDIAICRNLNVQLSANGGIIYSWTPIDGLDNPLVPNPIASPLISTTYTVTSYDGFCFYDSDSVVVVVHDVPELFAGADVEYLYGESFQLSATTNASSILWSPPDFLSCTTCLDPVVTHLMQPMTYTIIVTDQNGCRAEDSVRIRLLCKDDLIFVPNTFTPNGDNKNDIFRIRTYGLSEVKVFRVFNRWGEMVFETYDVNKGWDGYYKGQICYPAVYDYYIEGTCSDGNVLVKKGNVTLIR